MIRGAKQLITLRGPKGPRRGIALGELSVISDGSILIRDGRIAEVGPTRRLENLAAARNAIEIRASGKVVMPGFVDCHTHLIFPPSVASSEEAGERAVRACSVKLMQSKARAHLEAMARHGTTTVDVKTSGSGDGNLEIKLLRVLAALRSSPLDVIPSVLCRPADEAALDRLLAETLPKIRRRRLAQNLDIEWRDSTDDGLCRRLLGGAAGLGFRCRIDAAQPSPEAAIEIAAAGNVVAGIGHLEYAGPADAAGLGLSQAVISLLPGSGFPAETRTAPARALIDAGAAVALGSNFNPLHTPSLSMQAVVAQACLRFGMSPEEAICASTINGAWALGCAAHTGSIEPGKLADVVVLNVADYRELPNHFGTNLAYLTLKRGGCVYEEGEIMPRGTQARPTNWG